ncbi:MAG: hypothetical protein ACR2N9_12875 [Acidimicrobiia bacterium]
MSWVIVAATVALFIWSFAEAFAWPVVPDVALATAVFLAPSEAVVFVAATVAGSIAGGATAMWAYRFGMRWPLLLVSAAMEDRVAVWLNRGPIGLMHQPLTAVPYKAFVVEGARRGFGASSWALWTGVFRGARMTTVAAVAALVSAAVDEIFPSATTSARSVTLAIALALFGAGWWLAWKLWSRAESGSQQGKGTGSVSTMQP